MSRKSSEVTDQQDAAPARPAEPPSISAGVLPNHLRESSLQELTRRRSIPILTDPGQIAEAAGGEERIIITYVVRHSRNFYGPGADGLQLREAREVFYLPGTPGTER